MASFQAKTSRQRPEERENKNYRFDQFLPDPKYRISKKKEKKFKKIKEHHYCLCSSQNWLEKAEKKRK